MSIKTLSGWRVEARCGFSANGGAVYQVCQDIEVTQPDGQTYRSIRYLQNGKSYRFNRLDKAQAACDKANKG